MKLTSYLFRTNGRTLVHLVICGIMIAALSGCALFHKTFPSKSPARPPDARAQQQYYDLGVQQYSKENYGEAKEAFEKALELGPNTALGAKAQENLKKIQRILKTVEEIESK
jgi:Tfp pilus assembly protein PilF